MNMVSHTIKMDLSSTSLEFGLIEIEWQKTDHIMINTGTIITLLLDPEPHSDKMTMKIPYSLTLKLKMTTMTSMTRTTSFTRSS